MERQDGSDAPVVPVVPEHTFEQVAREWHARNLLKWTSGHAITIMARLQRDRFRSARSEGDTPLFDAANTASVTFRCIRLDRSAVAILVFVPECSPRIHRFGGPEGGERIAADG